MIRSDRSNSVPRRAFTLVELLATISVIFVIMGIAVVAYTAAQRSARSAADRTAVNGLQLAVGQFKAEFGFVPPLVKDLGRDGNGGPAFLVVRPDNTVTSEGDDRGRYIPLVYSQGVGDDGRVLRGRENANGDRLQRFSLLSIPYYILGALDAEVDGVNGLGFYEVRRDGTFAPGGYFTGELDSSASGREVESSGRSQRRYEPFFDISRGSIELANTTGRGGITGGGGVLSRSRISWRFELRDSGGIPIRYYRWVKDERELAAVFREEGISDIGAYSDREDPGGMDGEPGYYNVPLMVLNGLLDEPFETVDAVNAAVSAAAADPDLEFPFPRELRTATYAIMAAGPNQLFGDEVGADGSETITALANDDALRRRYAERLGLSEARLVDDAGYRAEAIALARADNIVEVGS